jgi:broad specificity polyphosphatase/5'/3'-nucleotidase SurE
MPEQTTATTSSTQGGLPNAIARGKSAVTSSITTLNQERKQADAEQAAESDDDVVEEIQGHPQDGRQHVYICRERGDHYVCQEEISIDEEMAKVERATR